MIRQLPRKLVIQLNKEMKKFNKMDNKIKMNKESKSRITNKKTNE
jgi:hypothetical protein